MNRDKHNRKRLLLWVSMVVLVGLVLAVGSGVEAAHLENRDSFCASCHSEPESMYVDRSVAAAPVDLASFHTAKAVRCIDCHSGPGIGGRISALTLGTRDLTHYLTGHYTQPAPQTRPVTDAQCTKCHSDVVANETFDNHFHVFLAQWQSLTPDAATCVSCHESHVTDGAADIAYLNQARTAQVCQACHSFAGQG
ncbi:MAG: cytochrome c3 family protein [Acidimicrobiia bacterium]